MKKFIVVSLMIVACSDAPVVVNGEIGLTSNNDKTVCVVDGTSYSCEDNSWTYYSSYHGAVVSCSNTGQCKTGENCSLWDGSKGSCQPR